MDKTERGRIQGLPKFMQCMMCIQLSQERLKLLPSNLAGTFAGSIQAKSHKKFGDKGAWAYPGTAQFFGYPLLSQTSNFVRTFIGSLGTKVHYKFREK